MYFTPQTRSTLGSPTYSDASTLIDPDDALIKDEEKCRVFDSATLSDIPALHHTPESPKTPESPCEERLEKGEHIPYINTHNVVYDEQLNQDTLLTGSPNVVSTPAIEPPSPQSTLGHGVPEELFQTILSYIWDVVWRPGARVDKGDYRGLGHLALVSRYWAKQVRHLILEELHIHGSHGVLRMKEVLNPPKDFGFEHPAALIRDLRLICSDSNPLWIHHVTQLVASTPDLARNVILSVDLVDYRRAPKGLLNCPRTVFYYLPKSLPSPFRHFYRLTLKNVQFNKASDMLHLVSEMSNLRSLFLDNVSWCPSSPNHSPDPMPTFLRNVVVFEADRYGHGGRGILPWVLASAIKFSSPRRVKSTHSIPVLSSMLRSYPWTSTHTVLPHPAQHDHILRMLDVFSHPDVSSILESPHSIEWDMARAMAGDPARPHAANLYITPRQRFPNKCIPPAVAPSVVFSFEPRRDVDLGTENLYVTRIALDVRSFKPSLEELLLYSWQEFIDATAQFEFLEAVNMCFTTGPLCSRMIKEHEYFINAALERRAGRGITKCTYSYRAEGEANTQWER